MEEKFSELDIQQIQKKGISIETIAKQLLFFKNGIAKVNLLSCATINSGIWTFSETEKQHFISLFDVQKNNYSVVKFVPASGAASRMFKFLNEFLNEFEHGNETINAFINRKKSVDLSVFLVGLKNFPFYQDLKALTISKYPNYFEMDKDDRDFAIIKTMLSEEGFDFANKPKGILPFHWKENKIITPIEEHIKETIFYEKLNEKAKIHFTISAEHQNGFEQISSKYPHVSITYSYQKESTDTIAVTLENEPFRDDKNQLLFRPGGHGALIENLNELQEDVVFIKNIDNVSQNHIVEIVGYKKLLGGILFDLQHQIFKYLNQLEQNEIEEQLLTEIIQFATQKINIRLPHDFYKYQINYQKDVLFELLNRPIRVCGMVKNEGEPGGGPFWVKSENGQESLQIVESSQIDMKNENQLAILNQATHFNPVDIVCGVKNYKGEKFDLTQFVDENTGFIVIKNRFGKPVKSFELPGLWNGAMANWITVFVEVPLTTFNPVKTVNDLLKPAHQPDLDKN